MSGELGEVMGPEVGKFDGQLAIKFPQNKTTVACLPEFMSRSSDPWRSATASWRLPFRGEGLFRRRRQDTR